MLALAKRATKPTVYVGTIAAMLWLAADVFDGASDRLNYRVSQVKDAVVEPTENTFNSVQAQCVKLWASIEANPGPSALAIGLFAFTVIYHKMKGRSTIAALKAGLLKEAPVDVLNPVLQKAHQAAIENQLIEMYEKAEARQKALPAEIKNAEDLVRRTTAARDKAATAAEKAQNDLIRDQGYLARLQREQDEVAFTIAQVETELNRA
jgi:hypothetical protein